ncbi:desulfoferrodoxin family protein [Sansalvadorimonas verongulae]|uniref:desulfoferrodoxin family protein n=1 Tax=Sansalvadorimonas verongulae TaxID=2172824 RepID=UPI0018AD14DD|nr:desulfoferrodoxin family protein [Sansalvadorimonas verongulae]
MPTMNRRTFLSTSTALTSTAVALLVQPALVKGEHKKLSSNALWGTLIFTAENPGRYSSKAKGHLPTVTVFDTPQGKTIRVETSHEMNSYQHYIVKHQLFDQHLQLIGEHMFNPKVESQPVSLFTLEDYSGPLYAISLCNKHDAWLTQTTV